MTLYVDKHRPTSLDSLSYHHDLSQRIRSLAAEGQDFPHLLFYGPSGAGKKTRIVATLRELYGPGVEKLRIDQRVFLTPSKRKLDVNVVQSNYHVELTPSDVGIYDRTVVQEIIKDIAQTQQVDLNAKKRFKVVVINEADLLSRDAQSALRRTMEKFTANLRLILCANSTSKIIGPIRSRCLLLRVGAPRDEEICSILNHVAKRETLIVPPHVSLLLARLSRGNLRRALLSLEALHTLDPTFAKVPQDVPERQVDTLSEVPRPDWETYCSRTAERILSEQSPERLLEVRSMLYELLIHCIPPQIIITTLMRRLIARSDEDMRYEIVRMAAQYEHRMKTGSKPIFHLEAFVAKFMALYKNYCLVGIEGFDID